VGFKMSVTPINRWTEQVVEDNGTRAYKVYSSGNPHYYMDKTGSLNPIDITNIQTITKGTVGEIKLREKNITSIGLRTDGNKTKYLGMRPDNTQEDGTQQLEWTIEEAIINNVTQSITLNQTNTINDVTTNLGGQVVQSTRTFTRQMVPVSSSINNFQVKYTLHLTGLQISNSKYTENTIIRNNISSSGTITAGTSYYKPDENGYFTITDSSNNNKFKISEPVLLDTNLEEILHISESVPSGSHTYNSYISNPTTHTLKDNGDGTYEYTKYPSDDLLKTQITSSVRYIDATTIYPSLDGQVASSGFAGWTLVHDSSTGVAIASAATDEFAAIYLFDQIKRLFLSFDTSGISVTPQSAVLKVYTTGTVTSDGIAIKATHNDISSGTFNDFEGWGSGWDDSDVTAYSAEVESFDANQYNDFTLNSTALDDITSEDTFKVCLMNHDYDYEDDDPGLTNNQTHIYLSEQSDTDKDPYLYIVEASVDLPLKLKGGKLSILGGGLVIK